MERKYKIGVARIAKELSESLLSKYSDTYTLGLGVALAILWEVDNDKPHGAAHQQDVKDILQWAKDQMPPKDRAQVN